MGEVMREEMGESEVCMVDRKKSGRGVQCSDKEASVTDRK